MTIHSFVDRLYEASVIHELWPGVLRDFARLANSSDAILVATRGEFRKWTGSSAHYEAICLRHYTFDSGRERTRRLFALDIPGFVSDLDVFEPDEIPHIPVYSDLLIPNGYGGGIATAVRVPTGDVVMFHAERPHEAGRFDAKLIERLNGLRPHLARSAILASRLSDQRARAATDALAALGLPAAVLDRLGRVVVANDGFHDLVPTVFQDRAQRLLLSNPNPDVLFHRALAGVLDSSDVAVGSVPVPASHEQPPVIVHLLPIKGAAHDIFSRSAALLVVTPVSPKEVPGATVLQGLFDLTPAEARVAQRLGGGATIGDIAADLNLSSETVRSQLKSVLAKVGLHRQAELVGLLRGLHTPRVT